MKKKTSEKNEKTIARQWLITQYTDGTMKMTEVKRKDAYEMPRDDGGKFKGAGTKRSAEVTPDEMVVCPYCGKSFRVGKKA